MSSTGKSRNVDIEIFMLAKTSVDDVEIRKWLDEMGVTNFRVPNITEATDAALLTSLAAKQCYMSFEPGLNPNVTKVRQDLCDYLDNILASGHGSVLEHVTFTFAINNVSRVFTGEMNRHRAGWAISERSMRYIRFEDEIKWWLPQSLTDECFDDADLLEKKRRTRAIFHRIFSAQSEAYAELVDLWDMDASDKNFHYKKMVTSCLRRIIGMGVATGGVWTGNVRALRHVLAMRCSKAAEEEIHHVFSRIANMMRASEPMLFGDFRQDKECNWTPKYHKV